MKLANVTILFDEQKKVLTVKEIADNLRCSESHILKLMHTDLLPYFMIGSHYRFLLADVLDCIRMLNMPKSE